MKKTVAVVLAVTAIGLTSYLAFGSTVGTKTFHNAIGTDYVDIRLEQLHDNGNGLSEITSPSSYMPGEKSSYIPRVKVAGKDCYVRMHLAFEMNEDSGIAISADDIYGLDENWSRSGDWLYCRKILRNGEHADPFRGISIPQFHDGNEVSGFKVKVIADAIQADNFHPDFNSPNPWGDVTIQESKARGDLTSRIVSEAKVKELRFRRDGQLDCPVNDLFGGFKNLVPGDSRTSSLRLVNDSGRQLAIYFRTDNDASDLLDEIELRIDCDGKCVYEGPLSSKNLESPIRLTALEAGRHGEFKYSIKMPKVSDNRFQEMDDQVVWIFELKYMDTGSIGSPRTGDRTWTYAVIAALICMLSAIVAIRLMARRREDEKNT